MKLGRSRPTEPHKIRFASFATPDLPDPPSTTDFASKASTSIALIYKNDQLGCCVIAGGYHITGVETSNAGAEFCATDEEIIADYSAIGGYVPGDPSTDCGCDELTAFSYWRDHGFADGTKIVGAVAIDATNTRETKQAIWLFENLCLAIELPDAWLTDYNMPTWDVAGDPQPTNGHCVIVVDYDSDGVWIVTWGMLKKLTWAAYTKYCVESAGGAAYAILTPDQLAKGKAAAPNGVDWTMLESDFAEFAAA
jgi:hypothetical protein